MKKLGLTLLALGLLFAALVALQLARLDAGELRDALASQASAALGSPVRVERAELAWWPLPALELGGVRAEGGAEDSRLAADTVRVGLSLLALCAGEVVPTRVAIAQGSVELGPWRLERVEAAGALGLDLGVSLEIEAEAPGLGRLRDGFVELSGATGGEAEWSGRATLDQVDLAALARAAEVPAQLRGRGRLVLRAEGVGARLGGGELELVVPDAGIHADGFALLGRVELHAALGKRWELDLSEAELVLGEVLSKPLGEELVLSALPDARLPPRAVREIRLRSEALALDAALDVESTGIRVSVEGAHVDLALLRPWWRTPWHPLAGEVVIHGADFASESRSLRLDGALASVSLPLPALAEAVGDAASGVADAPSPDASREAVTLDGPFGLEGTQLESGGLTIAVAGQEAGLRGHLDLASRGFDLDVETDALDVGRVLGALSGRAVLEGQLSAQASVRGRRERASWRGHGRFELADGRIPDADFPWPVEVHDPRLATGQEGREFDWLAGRFVLADGSLRFDELAFQHPYLGAHLRGDVALSDGALDLAGELEISEELDVGLGGEGRRRTLPVRRVSGTLRDPRFDMDRDVVSAAFQGYADRLRAEQQP